MRRFEHESGFGRQWWSVADRTPVVMEAGVRRAAGFLDAFIDAELVRLGLPAEAYALMGFSQGAMTVLFTGLRRAVAPRAILAFSGALVAPERLAAELANRAPVLLVHGEADDVVPAQRSRDAEAALRAANVPVEAVYVPRLGHGIDDTRPGDGRAGLAAGVLRRVRLSQRPSHCAFCETADHWVSGGLAGGMAAGASGMWESGPLRPLAGKFSGRGVWMRQ